MDKSLLKKAAIQSVALMIAVITSSYALNQYQSVTIEALSQEKNISRGNDTVALAETKDDREMGESEPELTEGQKLFPGADPNIFQKLGMNYLVIKKPLGEQLSLSLEDLYVKKSIQLNLSGITEGSLTKSMISRVRGEDVFNGEPKFTELTSAEKDDDGNTQEIVTRDYGNDIVHGITVSSVQDSLTDKYKEQILLELDSVYVYTIYEDSAYYYIKLQKPSEVYDKILVIDAGHGGKDGGATSKYGDYLEKNLNLEIVKELKKLLDQENIKVYYTRTKDETVYLRPREELANAVDCDYFISIHCNANEVSSPNGSEVLYYDNEFKGIKNRDLAKLLSKELGKVIALDNKGVVERHTNEIYIMDKAVVPMVLIEVGYITNKYDLDYISREENRKTIAQGIYNGIMKAYDILPVRK